MLTPPNISDTKNIRPIIPLLFFLLIIKLYNICKRTKFINVADISPDYASKE